MKPRAGRRHQAGSASSVARKARSRRAASTSASGVALPSAARGPRRSAASAAQSAAGPGAAAPPPARRANCDSAGPSSSPGRTDAAPLRAETCDRMSLNSCRRASASRAREVPPAGLRKRVWTSCGVRWGQYASRRRRALSASSAGDAEPGISPRGAAAAHCSTLEAVRYAATRAERGGADPPPGTPPFVWRSRSSSARASSAHASHLWMSPEASAQAGKSWTSRNHASTPSVSKHDTTAAAVSPRRKYDTSCCRSGTDMLRQWRREAVLTMPAPAWSSRPWKMAEVAWGALQ
mmetsp:Transcript_88953/g.275405  ORF Transcript_88953/g.275405 Transcript_88953/m.275405 type:complete len:293 (-) Transcript_88953:327-1205(-)